MFDTFKPFHTFLGVTGVSFYAKDNWDSKKWFIIQFINLLVVLSLLFFSTGFIVTHISDELLVEGASSWASTDVVIINLVYFIVFKKRFRKFLEEIAFQDPILQMPFIEQIFRIQLRDGSVNDLKNLVLDTEEKYLKHSSLFFKICLYGYFSIGTTYFCKPFIAMARTEDAQRVLAFALWIPWDMENPITYFITILYQLYAAFLSCLAMTAMLSIIFVLTYQIVRQLKLLTYIMQHIDDLAADMSEDRDNQWQTISTEILSQCVAHFVRIKQTMSSLDSTFRLFYLCLTLFSLVLVCMCSVIIATSDKLDPETGKYYLFGGSYVSLLFFFCVLAQQVENEHEKLEEAVTEKWYLFDAKHRASVRIFQLALSQRMPFIIFGSATLSLPTFSWFIRTTMSFFTMVMSVVDE